MFNLKKNTINYPVILFQCSPGLGSLDSWLSILSALRNKLPNAKFIFLSSNPGTMDQVDLESNLIKISKKIFDEIIFRSDAGILLSAKTFKEAKGLNFRSRVKVFYYVLKILKKIKLNFFFKFINNIYKVFILSMYSYARFNLNLLKNSKYVTLFDMTDLFKEYNRDLRKIITDRKNFSILHGTGIKGIQIRKHLSNKNNLYKGMNFKNTIAYLFSKYELPFYEKYLNKKNIRIYGIPKHDRQWIKFLLNQIKKI